MLFKNQKKNGFVTLVLVCVVAALIPILLLSLSSLSTDVSRSRYDNTKSLLTFSAVTNLAMLVQNSYVLAKTVGCGAGGVIIPTPGMNGPTNQVSLCLPTDPSIRNEIAPNNPFILNTPNALIQAKADFFEPRKSVSNNVSRFFSLGSSLPSRGLGSVFD